MESVKIDIYISDLLYQYDCVIVPDLGGFVGNYDSAKINEVHHRFTPPSKKISFNKNLVINDGLLINHLSQRETISYQDATKLVQAFVSKSWAGLKNGDKIKIEKVGVLSLDSESNIQFKAEVENDYLAESFGLNSFRVLPIKREEKTDKAIVKEIYEEGKKSKVVNIKKPLHWSAAAILLIAFLSTVLINSDRIDYQEIASYLPNATKIEAPIYKEHKAMIKAEKLSPFKFPIESSFTLNEGGRYILENKETKLFSKETIEANRRIDNTKVSINNTGKEFRFHVMAGCFSNYGNAKRLTSKLKKEGFQANFLGAYKNLNAVSYQSFATREEALALLEKVRNYHNGSAWLLEASF